jgi:hypothetical protein
MKNYVDCKETEILALWKFRYANVLMTYKWMLNKYHFVDELKSQSTSLTTNWYMTWVGKNHANLL